MDTDSEDEVFFGQITEKELAARKKNCPRRTTIFYRRDSLVAFQKQEKSSNVLRDSMGNLFIQDSFDEEKSSPSSSHKMSDGSGAFQSCKSSVASSVYETAVESLAETEATSSSCFETALESATSSSYFETALESETSPQFCESLRFGRSDNITVRKTNTSTFEFQDVKESESDSSAEPSEGQSDSEVSIVVCESSNSEISADSITLETKDVESSGERESKEISDKVESENSEIGDEIEENYEIMMENCEISDEIEKNDDIIGGIDEIKTEECEIGDEIEENDEIKTEYCKIGDENDEIKMENCEIGDENEENDENDEIKMENCETNDEIEDEIGENDDEIKENDENKTENCVIGDEIEENDEIKIENCDSSDDFISCTAQDPNSRPDSPQTGISEEFMPIEIEIMKNENFKFIDTTLGDESQNLSISSETSDSAEQPIQMTSADSAYTQHTLSSIETASYFTGGSSIPESRDSDYSENGEKPKTRLRSGDSANLTRESEKSAKAENDKDCQTSFWYIAVDKKKNCFIEPQQEFDNFVVPMVPPTKPPREIRKPTNYKALSENKLQTPQFRGKTPEKKFGQFKYKNVVSPVANYIKGSTVVTPLISNVLSNSISTNQKKKPTFHSESKIPRIFQPLQPIVHRH